MPTPPGNPVACLRCGDFVTAPLVRGVALCSLCLEGQREPALRMALPATVVKRRLRVVALLPLLMGVGFVVGHTIGGKLAAVVGLVLGELVALVCLFLLAFHMGFRELRLELREKLALPVGEDVAFVQYVSRRPKLWNTRIPFTFGFLFEGEGGLAFVADEGVRLAVPLEDVTRVSVDWLIMNPPASVLRIDRRSGSELYFAFKNRTSFRGNKADAVAARDRLAARLEAAKG